MLNKAQLEAACNKQNHIGLFNSKIEAALARDKVAKTLHGEFATLNFPNTQ